MEIQTGYAMPPIGIGRRQNPEAKALLSLKEGESLLLPMRKPDSRGGWAHLNKIANSRGLKMIQRREGDFIRFWTTPA